MDKHFTPMVFRILEGEVIALFPHEPHTLSDGGWLCTSYMHVGQHGGADPRLVYRTKPATWEQYAPLLDELQSEPYGYRIKILKRFPNNAYRVRRAEVARLKSMGNR